MVYEPLVFFSYVSEDGKRVRAYREYLEGYKFKVWMSGDSIAAGSVWTDEIDQNIRVADHVVIFLSNQIRFKPPDSYYLRERALALEMSAFKPPGYLIPVCLEKCRIPEEIERLHLQHLDIRRYRIHDIGKLVERISISTGPCGRWKRINAEPRT